MCGRFLLTSPAQVIAEAFGVEPPTELAPRYNIAPGQEVLAVRERAPNERELVGLRWGLIPYWSKEAPKAVTLINARAESAPERPAFRGPFRTQRCLVPANGFYEWQAVPAGGRGPKQPHLIARRDGAPFAFAGVWERWRPRQGPAVESCTLLTTDANDLVRPIHDRMPVILPPGLWHDWLDRGTRDTGRLGAMLRPYPGDEMTARPVGLWVNDARHEDPRCIEPQ